MFRTKFIGLLSKCYSRLITNIFRSIIKPQLNHKFLSFNNTLITHTEKGLQYEKEGNIDKAVEYWKKGATNINDAEAFYHLGKYYINNGKLDSAKEFLFRAYVEPNPEKKELLLYATYNLGKLYEKLGEQNKDPESLNRGIEYYEEVQNNPLSNDLNYSTISNGNKYDILIEELATYRIARSFDKLNNEDQALKYYMKTIANYNSGLAMFKFAEKYEDAGKNDLMVMYLTMATRVGNIEAMIKLADHYAIQNNVEQMLKYYEMASAKGSDEAFEKVENYYKNENDMRSLFNFYDRNKDYIKEIDVNSNNSLEESIKRFTP